MTIFVDVEIILKEYSNNISKKSIIAVAHRYLEKIIVRPNSVINNFEKEEHSILHNDVKTIIVGDIPCFNKSFVDFSTVEVNWFVYSLDTYGPVMQSESDGDEGEIIISTQLSLPSECLVNLWENLYYDHNIKQNVVLILGISGACRREELLHITIDAIEGDGSILIVKIPDTKTYCARTFTVSNSNYIEIYRKYRALRPPHTRSNRLFLKYPQKRNSLIPLLRYAQTMMEFSDKGVDSNVISCNRVILLHGPPGTGKTSLCKALAQKLTIRMCERFSSGLLIEINSHSLFSKWFSESGKLVNKMFNKIKEVIENTSTLVCVLIDEVESLAHARNQCLSGSEPSDSIRVVNALLTQIDQIKRHSNVLILATSNMTETIDLAFVDRADIKQYLGNPSVSAIYKVYHSCINELIKAQVIKEQVLESVETLTVDQNKEKTPETKKLLAISEKSLGLSGRSLRKIPFLAHALFSEKSLVDLHDFLCSMEKAVEKEHKERQYFDSYKKQEF